MAAAPGRAGVALSERLFREPYKFDFFQAVRLLERILVGRESVGRDAAVDREVVRFRAHASLSFPASSVADLKWVERPDQTGETPPEMAVAFHGLTGPAGVLPQHYTMMLLARNRAKDFSVRDFFDLFNHRLVSLYFRAWEKYRLPVQFERARRDPAGEPDPVTRGVYCLTGMGTDGLLPRLKVDPAAVLYYSGMFAHRVRPAVSLEEMLEDFFEMPIRVLQLQGRWLNLELADRARMPAAGRRKAATNQPGYGMVVGRRVWDVQSQFRVRVGPLTYDQFRRLMPDGDGLQPLCRMVRQFAGPDLDFDVQPVLMPEAVPPTQLSTRGDNRSRLGWNTWMSSKPFTQPVGDAVFARGPK
jgi:type VI secretion system protein ImpH